MKLPKYNIHSSHQNYCVMEGKSLHYPNYIWWTSIITSCMIGSAKAPLGREMTAGFTVRCCTTNRRLCLLSYYNNSLVKKDCIIKVSFSSGGKSGTKSIQLFFVLSRTSSWTINVGTYSSRSRRRAHPTIRNH